MTLVLAKLLHVHHHCITTMIFYRYIEVPTGWASVVIYITAVKSLRYILGSIVLVDSV